MKIVLDTNVFVSGLLRAAGPPGILLRLVVDESIPLFVDERILLEYEEVAARPRLGIDGRAAALVLEQIRRVAVMVTPRPLSIKLPDPDDLMFLETAVTGGADAIVTGNKKHFPPAARRGVLILSPREALQGIAEE